MCLLFLGVGTTQAQTAEQPVGFKVFFGTQSYNGDLGNEIGEFSDSDFLYGLGFSYYLNPMFDLSLDMQWMKLDRVNGPDDSVISQRNTRFDTDNFNANLMLRFKPLDTRLNPYLAAGIGGNFLQFDDTRVDESDFIFSVPFGLGVNYDLKENVMLNVQMVYNRTFNDKVDNYPVSSSETVFDAGSNPDLDGIDHDDFMTLSIGAVYTFGGGETMSMEERLLRQSMKNLEAAENANNEASATLRKAQELNDETERALTQLKEAQNQTQEQADMIRAEIVRVVNNVQFEFDKSEIIEPAYDELNSLADIMKAYPKLSIEVAGRADERGASSYNEQLSMRRAQAVKDYLVEQGVDASKVSVVALGESEPLMSGNSATAYAQNRSVQVTLSYNE